MHLWLNLTICQNSVFNEHVGAFTESGEMLLLTVNV